MTQRLGVFVYGTLRPGSWNHDEWLARFLAAPCRPATLEGFALHHHDGLPALVAHVGHSVLGDVADLRPERYDEALATLDVLEGTAGGHYVRATATTDAGEAVWLWIAGERITAALGEATLVAHGDWLALREG